MEGGISCSSRRLGSRTPTAPFSGSAVAQNAPATTTAAPKATNTKKPASGGLAAARERQKKCGAEWKETKAADKLEEGMTWPKYRNACNSG
jgi:hypothetical protein